MRISIKKLNLALAEKCMSLTDLRDAANVSPQTLGNIRNKQDYHPSTKTVGKIAKALGVSVEYLTEEA